MNCKPGDLALIVRPWQIERDIGRPVSVVRFARPGEVGHTRAGGCTVAANSAGESFSAGWLCDASGGDFPRFIADACLRPIRDSDGEDQMLTRAGKPSDIKTPVAA